MLEPLSASLRSSIREQLRAGRSKSGILSRIRSSLALSNRLTPHQVRSRLRAVAAFIRSLDIKKVSIYGQKRRSH